MTEEEKLVAGIQEAVAALNALFERAYDMGLNAFADGARFATGALGPTRLRCRVTKETTLTPSPMAASEVAGAKSSYEKLKADYEAALQQLREYEKPDLL